MRIPLITKYLEEKNMEYQNALLEKQVQEVQNIYLTMRGWRHDYHNHLQAMKAYVKMGEYDRLEEYLGLLEQDLDHVNQLIETGNVNLDAILNSKISLAQKNGIEIDYQAKCPETLAVSDIDLCALIGNLLDNAVESCEKLTTEKPFIRLYIGALKKQLYISVSNATNETVRKMDSEYISKKRGNHGHGLKRINLVVEKYGGSVCDGGYVAAVKVFGKSWWEKVWPSGCGGRPVCQPHLFIPAFCILAIPLVHGR